MDPWYGPLHSLKGSELWASVLKVVENGIRVIIRILKQGPIPGTIGSTPDEVLTQRNWQRAGCAGYKQLMCSAA